MADYNQILLTYILRNNMARDAIDHKIDSSNFPENSQQQKVWEMIKSHYNKYQTTPSVDIIKSKYPEFTEQVGEFTFDWLCDKTNSNKLKEEIKSVMHKVADMYRKDDDPIKMVDALTKFIMTSGESVRKSNDVSWTKTTEDRKDRYNIIKSRGGLVGIPCYWPTLTDVTGGMAPGQLWLVIGRAGTGKSFFTEILGYFAHKSRFRVLMFSKEMAYSEVFERMDAIYANVPFYQIRKGNLSVQQEYEYFEKLDDLAVDSVDLIVVSDDEGSGISGIDAKIAKYNPDIVFVDGIYLLTDDMRGSSQVERLSNISRSLKVLAKNRKLPIVATTQLNRNADKEKGMRGERENLSNIYGADALGQDADVVIELFQNKEMRDSTPQKMKASLIKLRQGGGNRWEKYINWDMTKMAFQELSDNEYEEFNPKVRPPIQEQEMFSSGY